MEASRFLSSRGRVTFSAEGRMMSVVCDGRPELPPGVQTIPPIAATTRTVTLSDERNLARWLICYR